MSTCSSALPKICVTDGRLGSKRTEVQSQALMLPRRRSLPLAKCRGAVRNELPSNRRDWQCIGAFPHTTTCSQLAAALPKQAAINLHQYVEYAEYAECGLKYAEYVKKYGQYARKYAVLYVKYDPKYGEYVKKYARYDRQYDRKYAKYDEKCA